MEGVCICVCGFRSSLPGLTALPALSRVMFSQQRCCADAAGVGPAQPQGTVFIVSTTYICLLTPRQLARAHLSKIKTQTPASSWLWVCSIVLSLRITSVLSFLSARSLLFVPWEIVDCIDSIDSQPSHGLALSCLAAHSFMFFCAQWKRASWHRNVTDKEDDFCFSLDLFLLIVCYFPCIRNTKSLLESLQPGRTMFFHEAMKQLSYGGECEF